MAWAACAPRPGKCLRTTRESRKYLQKRNSSRKTEPSAMYPIRAIWEKAGSLQSLEWGGQKSRKYWWVLFRKGSDNQDNQRKGLYQGRGVDNLWVLSTKLDKRMLQHYYSLHLRFFLKFHTWNKFSVLEKKTAPSLERPIPKTHLYCKMNVMTF